MITEEEVRVDGMEGLIIALLAAIGFCVLLLVVGRTAKHIRIECAVALVLSVAVMTGVIEL